MYEPRDIEARLQQPNPLIGEGDVIFQEIQDR